MSAHINHTNNSATLPAPFTCYNTTQSKTQKQHMAQSSCAIFPCDIITLFFWMVTGTNFNYEYISAPLFCSLKVKYVSIKQQNVFFLKQLLPVHHIKSKTNDQIDTYEGHKQRHIDWLEWTHGWLTRTPPPYPWTTPVHLHSTYNQSISSAPHSNNMQPITSFQSNNVNLCSIHYNACSQCNHYEIMQI